MSRSPSARVQAEAYMRGQSALPGEGVGTKQLVGGRDGRGREGKGADVERREGEMKNHRATGIEIYS